MFFLAAPVVKASTIEDVVGKTGTVAFSQYNTGIFGKINVTFSIGFTVMVKVTAEPVLLFPPFSNVGVTVIVAD